MPESILNLRDVAVTVNDFLGQPLLKEGVLYRSAHIDNASIEDRIFISQGSEQIPRIDGLPLQIAHVEHVRISMPSRRYKLQIVWQLSFLDILSLIWIAISAGIMQAKEFIIRKVVVPLGLSRLTIDGIGYSHPELAAAIRTLIRQPAVPVLVHCAQGKDRTGLVIALVLMLLDCPRAAIEHDYHLSDNEITIERAETLAYLRQKGLTQDFARTVNGLIEELEEHLDVQYGGVSGFANKVGITDSEMEELKELLLEDPKKKAV
ncbi:Tyrosine-protein phosphatase [Ceratocystis platani]|uniref:Tyrosine-protein phosphatase n=1 Tax=Ceratocystis fimbriata f. sp. platani TaxID=88771 RepID=A0A0F8BR33_CERFI|nr:Tyrosine-protein phosphatase [Ceratocystis platani]